MKGELITKQEAKQRLFKLLDETFERKPYSRRIAFDVGWPYYFSFGEDFKVWLDEWLNTFAQRSA